jgi:hypothetical protein
VITGFAFLLIISACAVTDNNHQGVKFSFQAGANKGGITENTDMTGVPGAEVPPEATEDAFSGGTHTGINAGIHVN